MKIRMDFTGLRASLALCLLLLSGCSADTAANPVDQTKAQPQTLQIQAALAPEKAKVLQENLLTVTVTDLDQKKVEQAEVTITLSMPGMDHGQLSVKAEKTEAGSYEAKVIPVMVGDWIADIRIVAKDQTATYQFPFQAVP